RIARARAAEHADNLRRAQIKQRLEAQRAAARPALRNAWSDAWWRRAAPKDIADAYQLAAGWAGTGDGYAAAVAEDIRARVRRRYGIEVPEPASHENVLAALMAAGPGADVALAEAGEQFAEAAGERYRYQVRDAGGGVLGEGELLVPAGASPADAALAAL